MTDKALKLSLAKVDGLLFEGPVDSVVVPGIDGEMTILANHEPFISPLQNGVVKIINKQQEVESFDIEGGTVEVSDNQVSIILI